ncbi:MAG: glycerol-3-phosphate acyltransferase [Bacillota bacterium]
MIDLLLAAGAYFIGAIPFAYLCGRLFKRVDIRQAGSGNIGAMNAFRNIGRLPGILTALADIAKGAVAVYLALLYGNLPELHLLSAFLVVLGHNYNIFLGFKGGKGLAALAGVILVLSPLTFLYALTLVIVLFLLIRDINTTFGVGVFSLPLFFYFQTGSIYYALTGLAIALTVAAKHVKDFQAYREGRRKFF